MFRYSLNCIVIVINGSKEEELSSTKFYVLHGWLVSMEDGEKTVVTHYICNCLSQAGPLLFLISLLQKLATTHNSHHHLLPRNHKLPCPSLSLETLPTTLPNCTSLFSLI
ncbi:hypothetical protein SK128_024357 [Halocaridina rubra]|uniref:Uncharacterized protein n=1 Tax=Halocaridina rubra TaxID=373956 RepID=A0AAN8WQG8_HALRR